MDLQVRQLRVPMGVVGMIYEARPNVTVDAAVLALKSGNVALLRGSSSAFDSNTVLVDVMREALAQSQINPDAILLVPGTSHDSVKELLTARGLVDVIIPRGGADLINSVVENSTVPVIETGVGNCHVYVDADADIDTAVSILVNAKTQRVSVCNAAESLLVHADIADRFLPVALAALDAADVTVHADADVAAAATKSASRRLKSQMTTGRPSTTRWTSPQASWNRLTRRLPTSVAGPPATPKRSSLIRQRRSRNSREKSIQRQSWSTRRRDSQTEPSLDSAPKSASRLRNCMLADPWAWPN